MSAAAPPHQFHYRIDWRARAARPGSHRGVQRGGGAEFSHHAPLLDAPDPRRFDLRASLRDPFERALVRVYKQPSAIPLYCLADLSASMNYRGETRKLDLLADFAASCGYSAYRSGDWFGFVGADRSLRDEFSVVATRRKTAGVELAERLRGFTPSGRGADGLLAGAERLAQSRTRALVFLISDFHLPLTLLRRLLRALSLHQVVPVVLWEPGEYRRLPRYGLARLRDAETGRQRTLLLRPSLGDKIRARFAARRAALEAAFVRDCGAPLWLHGRFDADAVTRYFY